MKKNRFWVSGWLVTLFALAGGRLLAGDGGAPTQSVVHIVPVRPNPAFASSRPLPPGIVITNSAANPGPIVAVPPRLPLPVPPVPVQTELPKSVIAWDADNKEVTVKGGTPEARFTFSLTNLSSSNVTIRAVQTSCGCTAAHLPAMPWTLAAGTNSQFDVTMNLLGKIGMVTKTITISSDCGIKILFVKTTIEPAVTPVAAAMGDRQKNQQLALADRQAVFKGDCAKCHVEPTVGKTGKELYAAACGICHDSEHRASMVPDLRALNHDTNPEFWKTMTEHGKPASLMPAFAVKEDGILTDAQIASLVDFLSKTVPAKATAQVATPAHPTQ
jgi:mono/diheme cytochrome c family protein